MEELESIAGIRHQQSEKSTTHAWNWSTPSLKDDTHERDAGMTTIFATNQNSEVLPGVILTWILGSSASTKIFHLSRPCWIFVHSEATGEVRVKPTPWKALARHDVSRCFVGRVIDLKGTWHPVWSFGRLDGIVRFSYRLYWSLFRSISLCFKFVKVFPAEKSVHKGRDSFCAWPAFWRATSWRLACKTVLWTRRISLWWQILRSSPNSGTARVGHG